MHEPPSDPQQRAVVDSFGRTLRYIRISVTDLCNLSCTYCNPVKGCASQHPHKLSWDDLAFLVDVSITDLGAEAIRITGGEPTIRPGLVEWIGRIAATPGLRDISMTTNGILLGRMAKGLREAGLRRVNVSLDTFDPVKFTEITRGGSIERCFEGIHTALQVFDRVKLNSVLMRDFNVPELERYIEFSHELGVEVRFIELMPIFDQKEYFHRNFISVEEVVDLLDVKGLRLIAEGNGRAEGNLTGYGPATTFRIAGSRARIGFISQMSSTKCLYCNKLRLTSDGALKPCLLSPEEVDLAPAIKARDRATVAAHMRRQFLIRAERYDFEAAVNGSLGRSMQATGG